MRAIDLFNAMQNRTQVYIPTKENGTILCLINGMIAEDGSGSSWMVYVHTVNLDTHWCLYVRTTDKGGKFSARVMV